MKLLYWNLNRKHLEDAIGDLADEHQPEIMIFSEYALDGTRLLPRLNHDRTPYYEIAPMGEETGQRLVSIFDRSFFEKICDDRHISAWKFRAPGRLELLLFSMHLPSKLHQSSIDQSLFAPRWREAVESEETKAGHHHSIVVGDMNMDPFECGIISSEGFHATMSRRVALRGSRTVQFEERRFFYNPMWRHFGERPGAPLGTYYYDNSGAPVNYYWHLFDQVLVRPELLDRFQDESVAVLSRAGNNSLVDDNGIPDRIHGSDHLPIIFSLDEITLGG